MKNIGGTPSSSEGNPLLITSTKPEWQWGDYYPASEDEQRRAYVLDCISRMTWENDGAFLASLELVDQWLKTGKVPPPEGEKKPRTKLGAV